MLDLLKDYCNCFLLSLVKKHLNKHTIFHFLLKNVLKTSLLSLLSLLSLFKFITQSCLPLQNSFLFLSRFSVSLKSIKNYFFRFACKSPLNRFSVLINYVIYGLLIIFLHPAVSHAFQGPGFLGSRFFSVQVFLGLGFSRSRFLRVQVFLFQVFQIPGPGSGSRFQKKPQFML